MNMEIRKRYNTEETYHSFSLQPYKHQLKLSWYFLLVVIVTGAGVALYHKQISEGVLICLYFAMTYLTVHSLYDILIRADIRFVFDRASGRILKVSKYRQRTIMQLKEAIIFTHLVNGSWYYSLGARGSHLVKSYMISESFSRGKRSQHRQEQYESEILMKIKALIQSCQH